MSIGFIGTGSIAEAVITGLLHSNNPPEKIIVSPRNNKRATTLASKFTQVEVAKDNQAVIDNCDTVCLSIRPQIAESVLNALVFPKHMTVVSFVATYSISILESLVAPANKIVRLVPLPPAAKCMGPLVISPPDEEVEALFGGIGTIVHAENDDQYHAIAAVTAMMAPYFGLLSSVTNWLKDRGLPAEAADTYVATLFHVVSDAGLSINGQGFETIATEYATPGGLNEQLLRELTNAGCYDNISKGLSLIFERINGRAGLKDTINHYD